MVISNLCNSGMLDCNDVIGKVILGWLSTTGSTYLAFLLLFLLLIAIAFMFSIRLEYTAIIILPLLLALMAVTGEFMTFGVITMIYLAIVATGNFILK